MELFGEYGYKKTSTSNIAKKSEMSKSMVFYYFGSKLNLYCYLIELSYDEVINAIDEKEVFKIGNFFDRLQYIVTLEINALNKLPGVMNFLKSFYFEEDVTVLPFKQSCLEKNENLKNNIMLTDLDENIFKETVNPRIVFNLITIWNMGMIQSIQYKKELDFNELTKEALECIEMMKVNFCKEEYL